MNIKGTYNDRRDFLKKCGLSTVPFLLPALGLNASPVVEVESEKSSKSRTPINFFSDGLALTPQEYLDKLTEINKVRPIEPDLYGHGGTNALLEQEFAKLTGKEKAIYLPTGTMANQIAIKLLNGNNTKIVVPENSHIYRDEADAAQSVHHKRLIPVGEGKPYFELEDLKKAIQYTNENEVFKSGLGTVVIENPVRRADGTVVPIETIRAISSYCRENGFKLHLDGARIHLASAYTKVSLAEYASYFDTVYISLYKYLNAAGGAILCGEAQLIDQLPHQIKIHGGTVYKNWNNTSVALHYLEGITGRWEKVVQAAGTLVSELNKIDGVIISSFPKGTNIYHLTLAKEVKYDTLSTFLKDKYNIRLGRGTANGTLKIAVNESLLTRNINEVISAWKEGVNMAQS